MKTAKRYVLCDKIGYIQLVDSMPAKAGKGDERIVEAARASLAGDEVQATSSNEKLIRFLVRHGHTSPLEHVKFTMECRMPIFVARQVMRHRCACLSEDVMLDFERPDTGAVYPVSVGDAYRRWQDPAQKAKYANMRLRSLDESTGEKYTTNISNIWLSGEQPVYKVTLSNGKHVTLTLSHRVLTNGGWMTAGQALERGVQWTSLNMTWQRPVQESPNAVRGEERWHECGVEGYEVSTHGRVRSYYRKGSKRSHETPVLKTPTVNSSGYYVVSAKGKVYTVHSLVATAFLVRSGWEVRHLDGNRLNNHVDNLAWGTPKDNSDDMRRHGSRGTLQPVFCNVQSVEFKGVVPTYDIEVTGPFHNFLANGVVVHNSYNEESGRYGVMREDIYVPSVDRLSFGGQSESNKQCSGGGIRYAIATGIQHKMAKASKAAYKEYKELLGAGLAREIARGVLPVNTYTQFMWTTDVHNASMFCKKRLPADAQWECRQYAVAMRGFLELLVPVASKYLFEKGV